VLYDVQLCVMVPKSAQLGTKKNSESQLLRWNPQGGPKHGDRSMYSYNKKIKKQDSYQYYAVQK